MKNLTFIGTGNMAQCLIGGLIQQHYPATRIWAAGPETQQLTELQQKWGIHTTENNQEGAKQADVLIFAVKPQIIKEVAKELAPILNIKKPLIISIVAGAKESHFKNWLGDRLAIVRCMPNTPALVGQSATVMFANSAVSEAEKNLAATILSSVGMTLWIDDERQMDAITSLSGSGPAYFFLVMEALEEAGVQLGLPRALAKTLTRQTALGSAQMAADSSRNIADLRQQVTSPGGGTEQALRALEAGNIRQLFENAVTAACQRYIELSKQLLA